MELFFQLIPAFIVQIIIILLVCCLLCRCYEYDQKHPRCRKGCRRCCRHPNAREIFSTRSRTYSHCQTNRREDLQTRSRDQYRSASNRQDTVSMILQNPIPVSPREQRHSDRFVVIEVHRISVDPQPVNAVQSASTAHNLQFRNQTITLRNPEVPSSVATLIDGNSTDLPSYEDVMKNEPFYQYSK